MAIRFAEPWLLLLAGLVPVAYLLFRRFGKKHSPLMDGLRITVRVLLLVTVIAAIAGPQIVLEQDKVNLLYLVDVSDSVGSAGKEAAIEFIKRTSSSRGPEDTFGVLAFGAEASPELLPAQFPGEVVLESIVDTSATDIESALYRSVSLFPDSGENRIVLLSDGNETRGNALQAAQGLAAMRVQIYPAQGDRQVEGNEALVQDIIVPREVNKGQVHDVTVLVHSESETEASLYIFRDGLYMGEDVLSIPAGQSRYTYASRIDDAGSHIYEVYIQLEDDTIEENNMYRASVFVTGEPVVLYVSSKDEAPSGEFLAALAAQGIATELAAPEDFPTDFGSLLQYDTVIFDNVPAFDISMDTMGLIEDYVKDAGGGFLMVGGDQSFGIGGYFATPVEKALPVDMDVTSSMNIPSLALFMVVDKSGSMGDTIASGETKLDLVKEAVIASVEVLNPFYTVGLLAFDADFEWTVLPTNAGDRQRIIDDMSGLKSGGGTHLYPALEEAYSKLKSTKAAVKHVLVLSDGLTDEGDFELLAGRMGEDGITVSTVSVGGDSDRELLSMIADVGGGRSYFTDDIQRIPRIFASESIIVSRGLIVEETFIPIPGVPSDITDGVNFTVSPPLRGFVLTYPKTGAQTVLSAFNNNPLLSTWSYGLGRTAAYTSDFRGKWGVDLITWEEFPIFAAQLVRWLRRPPSAGELSVTVEKSGEMVVDALSTDGSFINGLGLKVIEMGPDGVSQTAALEQTAPGRYEHTAEVGESGDYYFTVYGEGAGRTFSPETHILTLPYPAEYSEFRPNHILLEDLARVTGGESVKYSTAQSGRLFSRSENALPALREVRRFFVLLALVLLIADIALRQIPRSPHEEEESERESLLRRIRSGSELRNAKRATYEELLGHLHDARMQESKQRDISYWFGKQRKAPDTTLRLYLAKIKNR